MKPAINRSLRHGLSATRALSAWEWLVVPMLISMGLTLVFATPLQPFGLSLPEPVWPIVLAFAWPLIRPSYFAPALLAVHGLFLDYFWGAPTGFYTFSLMLVYGGALVARTFLVGQEWRMVFGCYVLSEFVFFLMSTIVSGLDTGTVPRLIGVFEQMLATTCLYPLVLIMLERFVHSDNRFQ